MPRAHSKTLNPKIVPKKLKKIKNIIATLFIILRPNILNPRQDESPPLHKINPPQRPDAQGKHQTAPRQNDHEIKEKIKKAESRTERKRRELKFAQPVERQSRNEAPKP
jgi:hypothetical protein